MLAALAWLAGFVWFVMSLPKPAPLAARTDGVVVLTGGPGRIHRGVELLQAKSARRLLISGVAPSVRPIELAVGMGIPPALFDCCIDLGKRAADTRGNGEEIADWVAAHKYRSVRIVTSQFHMARAVADFLSFDEAYARIDWRRFAHLPTFDAANRGNAYNVYLQMEAEALGPAPTMDPPK